MNCNRIYSVLGVLSVSIFGNVAACGQSNTPPKSWIDPDTGHRIIRLTDEPNSASLYFNVNAYSPDGQQMIYTTSEGVSVLNLHTLETHSIVKGKVRVIQAGSKTPSVFYIKPEENALYVTNYDTGTTKKLGSVPAHGSIATVNADETLASGTYEETTDSKTANSSGSQQMHALEQPRNKGEMMVRRLAARIPLVVFTMNLTDGGTIKPLFHSTNWIGHMLFSPTDPTLLMYCHEGPWQAVDRIWTIHTDGTHNQLMHQRHMAMEIAGHEFWQRNGDIWYDLQTPKGQDFFLAGIDLQTGNRIWYHMQRNEWSIHFNVNHNATLFAGDGGDPTQVAKATNGEWIYLYRPEQLKNTGLQNKDFVQPGIFHAEKLVNMSRHNYTLEPNVSFTPDEKMIIFRSNMFGPTYVFGVEIEKVSK